MMMSEALQPIADFDPSAVLVTTMGAVNDWPAGRDGPQVFHYVPSSMGQGPALGLGLALGAPESRIVVINGDGCMLMNLGCLATIAEQNPRNFALVVIDNGIYEVTGGQARVGRGRMDFPAIARGCGIEKVFGFADPAEWSKMAAEALSLDGPLFICLTVEPRFGQTSPKPKRPMANQIADLRQVLSGTRS